MAGTILVSDDLSLASATQDSDGTHHYVRRFLVDVSGTPVPGRLFAAAHQITGIPAWGAPHPTITNLFVYNLTASFIPGSQLKAHTDVTYKFGNPFACWVSWSSTTVTEKTTLTSAGNNMYVFPPGGALFGQFGTSLLGTDNTTRQPFETEIQKSVSCAKFKRIEIPPVRTDIPSYKGHVNSVSWFGRAPYTALCLDIRYERSEGSEFYRAEYTFAIDPNGWRQTAYYKDPDTGGPMIGVNYADGSIFDFDIYPVADFNQLLLGNGNGQ